MIRKNTVFVLGAGASKDYGLPTGQELVDIIAESVPSEGSDEENKVSSILGVATQALRNFASRLRQSNASSIDSWLEKNPPFVSIGKAFICQAIGSREDRSNLYKRDWYATLWDKMTSETKKTEDLLENKVSFITFNYDRSLEAFLETSAANLYPVIEGECEEILREIHIIHVYGQAGYLSWQSNDDEKLQRSYYQHFTWAEAKNCSQAIKVLHEGQSATEEFEEAKKLLRAANTIYFFGFGYYPDNMVRLQTKTNAARIIGSYRGVAIPKNIEDRKHNGFGNTITIHNQQPLSAILRDIAPLI